MQFESWSKTMPTVVDVKETGATVAIYEKILDCGML